MSDNNSLESVDVKLVLETIAFHFSKPSTATFTNWKKFIGLKHRSTFISIANFRRLVAIAYLRKDSQRKKLVKGEIEKLSYSKPVLSIVENAIFGKQSEATEYKCSSVEFDEYHSFILAEKKSIPSPVVTQSIKVILGKFDKNLYSKWRSFIGVEKNKKSLTPDEYCCILAISYFERVGKSYTLEEVKKFSSSYHVKSYAEDVLNKLRSDGWVYGSELLVEASRLGYELDRSRIKLQPNKMVNLHRFVRSH